MNKIVEQMLRARPGFSSYNDLTHKKYGLAFNIFRISEHILPFTVFQFIYFQFYIYMMVISMNHLVTAD